MDKDFSMFDSFQEAKFHPKALIFTMNRAYRFKENDKFTYKIVADWVIGEYNLKELFRKMLYKK